MNPIIPNWPAPKNIIAFTTTRQGGFSKDNYASLNLGDHVNDDPSTVMANRKRLIEEFELPSQPIWLSQKHTSKVIAAETSLSRETIGDGSYTNKKQVICAVLTADCLPILLCDKVGSHVAALHCGWRGLASNIIAEGFKKMNCAAKEMLAWLGPGIGPNNYELGEEVKQQFIELNPNNTSAFQPSNNGKWLGNMYQIAKIQLQQLGINNIYGSNFCTYGDQDKFFSYRRDKITGRMATLIWLR